MKSKVRHLVLPLVLLGAASCGGEGGGGGLPDTCEGHVELCDRRFDQVAFAATHNSMADTDTEAFAPCQTHDITRQLEDGVRGFMLDTHYDPIDTEAVMLCHGACLGNYRSLTETLTTFDTFLDAHRDAIVTIIFEAGPVSVVDIEASFEAAGVLPRTYTHTLGTPWPTLRELIVADTRLVVVTDEEGSNGSGPTAWYMDQWAFGFQNPYAAMVEADFSCDVDRGTAGANQLFIMNHFLTAPFASLALARTVNPYASLGAHASRCRTERGQIPNFVTVDFYETGDLFHVVDELNGFVSGPPN